MHFLCNMRCFAQFFWARSLSRPARGGWIEMLTELVGIYVEVVPPRKGRVD